MPPLPHCADRPGRRSGGDREPARRAVGSPRRASARASEADELRASLTSIEARAGGRSLSRPVADPAERRGPAGRTRSPGRERRHAGRGRRAARVAGGLRAEARCPGRGWQVHRSPRGAGAVARRSCARRWRELEVAARRRSRATRRAGTPGSRRSSRNGWPPSPTSARSRGSRRRASRPAPTSTRSLATAVAQLGVRIDEMAWRDDGDAASLEQLQGQRSRPSPRRSRTFVRALRPQEDAVHSQRLDELGWEPRVPCVTRSPRSREPSLLPRGSRRSPTAFAELAAEREAQQALARRLDEVDTRLSMGTVTAGRSRPGTGGSARGSDPCSCPAGRPTGRRAHPRACLAARTARRRTRESTVSPRTWRTACPARRGARDEPAQPRSARPRPARGALSTDRRDGVARRRRRPRVSRSSRSASRHSPSSAHRTSAMASRHEDASAPQRLDELGPRAGHAARQPRAGPQGRPSRRGPDGARARLAELPADARARPSIRSSTTDSRRSLARVEDSRCAASSRQLEQHAESPTRSLRASWTRCRRKGCTCWTRASTRRSTRAREVMGAIDALRAELGSTAMPVAMDTAEIERTIGALMARVDSLAEAVATAAPASLPAARRTTCNVSSTSGSRRRSPHGWRSGSGSSRGTSTRASPPPRRSREPANRSRVARPVSTICSSATG